MLAFAFIRAKLAPLILRLLTCVVSATPQTEAIVLLFTVLTPPTGCI